MDSVSDVLDYVIAGVFILVPAVVISAIWALLQIYISARHESLRPIVYQMLVQVILSAVVIGFYRTVYTGPGKWDFLDLPGQGLGQALRQMEADYATIVLITSCVLNVITAWLIRRRMKIRRASR
jgi:hypothetical protein